MATLSTPIGTITGTPQELAEYVRAMGTRTESFVAADVADPDATDKLAEAVLAYTHVRINEWCRERSASDLARVTRLSPTAISLMRSGKRGKDSSAFPIATVFAFSRAFGFKGLTYFTAAAEWDRAGRPALPTPSTERQVG